MNDMATRLLEESLGKSVLIRLRGSRSLRGKLQGFDQHMNLVLGEAEDISNSETRRLGTIIVRGDNVILISPPQK